jgi:nitrite reductase/ring-hydroxylating ferredoxin subunit
MFSAKKYNWFKISGSLSSIPWQSNNLCIVVIDGKSITLAKWDGKLYAFSHKCPHAGGILADGEVDVTGNIVCPVHHYKFKLGIGFNTSGEGYCLKNYVVEQRNDGFYVGLEQKGLFN